MPVGRWSPWCICRGTLIVGSGSQECAAAGNPAVGGLLLLLAKYVDGERKNACECPFLEINVLRKVRYRVSIWGEISRCFLGYGSNFRVLNVT